MCFESTSSDTARGCCCCVFDEPDFWLSLDLPSCEDLWERNGERFKNVNFFLVLCNVVCEDVFDDEELLEFVEVEDSTKAVDVVVIVEFEVSLLSWLLDILGAVSNALRSLSRLSEAFSESVLFT